MPRAVFLIPGVGAQGGKVEDLAAAFTPGRAAALITVSRALVNAWWWFSDAVRVRREQEDQLAETVVQLELDRQENARRAVFDERVRIARELHDVVAHHVSVMGVQAGAARRVLQKHPEKAEEALSNIEAASREAVQEMHRLLGFLRQEPEDTPLAPQPGMSQLPTLVDQMRDAGLPVDVEIAGSERALPPTVDLSAYRIVQEALTNTLRHAGPARATVKVNYCRQRHRHRGARQRPQPRHEPERGRNGSRPDRHARAGHAARRQVPGRPSPGRRLFGPRPSPARRQAGMSIRVLLADDQAMVRAGFRMILESEPDIEVVGEAEDGAKAVSQVRALRPDVVLMDVQMPNMDGLEATRQIAALDLPDPVRVLILTTFERDEYIFEALRSGASGFMLKNAAPEELIEAVRIVAGGNSLLAPSVTRRVIEEFAKGPAPAAVDTSRLNVLTEREAEVLALLARGKSNAEIANELYVGEATVKTHISNMLTKLNLRDRVQAVVFAYESGLIRPGN